MRRRLAIVGSALFLVVAPGTVAGLIPWWISGWLVHGPLFGLPVSQVVGVFLVAAGLPLLLDTFSRFALQGVGTPAPVFPTRDLVVGGPYRHVRNPMYTAVLSQIFGQGLLLGNPLVLGYGLVVCAAFHSFVLLYEEPTLHSTFGSDYDAYCEHVPRWLPRIRPWTGH